jgi:hypothetical protein
MTSPDQDPKNNEIERLKAQVNRDNQEKRAIEEKINKSRHFFIIKAIDSLLDRTQENIEKKLGIEND